MGLSRYDRLRAMLDPYGEIVAPELVDTPQKAAEAGEMFRRAGIDLLLIFPFGYTPSMDMLPAVRVLDVPIRLLNAHEGSRLRLRHC